MSDSINDKTNGHGLKEPSLFKSQKAKKNAGGVWLIGLLMIAGATYWITQTRDVKTIGVIKAERLVKIGAVMPGVLKEIAVKNGDSVKAGMLVLKFENSDLSQDLAEQSISLERMNHELVALMKSRDYLDKDFGRLSVLFENKVIGQSAYELAESTAVKAKEAVAAKQKEIDAVSFRINFLKTQMQRLNITAPFSGAVVGINSDLSGNYIKEGDEVLRLADTSSYYLETGIRESRASHFKVGDRVKVRFDTDPTQVYSGEISKMAPAIHEDVEKVFKIKRLVMCSIKLDSMPEEIRFGMQARVTLHPSH